MKITGTIKGSAFSIIPKVKNPIRFNKIQTSMIKNIQKRISNNDANILFNKILSKYVNL